MQLHGSREADSTLLTTGKVIGGEWEWGDCGVLGGDGRCARLVLASPAPSACSSLPHLGLSIDMWGT